MTARIPAVRGPAPDATLSPGTRRLVLRAALPFAALVLWRYVVTHRDDASSLLARHDLGEHLANLALTALCGLAVLGGAQLWWRTGRMRAGLATIPVVRGLLASLPGVALLGAVIGPGVLADLGRLAVVSAGVALYLFLHLGAGLRLLRGPLRAARFSRLESRVLATLLALGLHAVVLFALSVLMLPPLAVSLPLLALMALAVDAAAWRRLLACFRPARPGPRPARRPAALWCFAFGAVALGVLFLNPTRVAAPPTSPDAMHVHLAAPKAYLVHGGMDYIPQLRSSAQIPLMQCQFTPLLALFGELGPKLLSGAYLAGLALLTFAFARRVLPRGDDRPARLAALLVCATPVVLFLAGMCYLDLPATLYLLAAFGLALRWGRPADGNPAALRALALLTGAFLAFVFLVKVQAWAVVVPVLLVLGAAAWRRPAGAARRQVAAGVGLAGLVALALTLPFLVRSALAFGNPFWPLFTGLLGTRDELMSLPELAVHAANLGRLGMGHGLLDFLALPARLVLHESHFQAGGWRGFGVIWLLLLPLGLGGALQRRLWWTLPFVLAFAVPWFSVTQELRYLVYVLPVCATAVAAGLSALGRLPRGSYGVLVGAVLVSASLQAPTRDVGDGTLALSGEEREAFVRRRVPPVAALARLAALAAPDDLVWTRNLETAKYHYPDPSRLLGDHFGRWRATAVLDVHRRNAFHPAPQTVAALTGFGVRWLAIAANPTYDLRSLRLELDPELARHLSLRDEVDGVLLYAFDLAGGFEPPPPPPPAADLLTDGDFDADDHAAWNAPGALARFLEVEGERVLHLPPGAQVFQTVPLPAGTGGDSYRLHVSARRAEAGEGRLRLQLTWLPAGGWKALDDDGQPLVRSESRVMQLLAARWLEGELSGTATPAARDVVVYLVNDGPVPVELDTVRLAHIPPRDG